MPNMARRVIGGHGDTHDTTVARGRVRAHSCAGRAARDRPAGIL